MIVGVGDKVKILNKKDSHAFKVGEVVEITSISGNGTLEVLGSGYSYTQQVSGENVEPITGTPVTPKGLNKDSGGVKHDSGKLRLDLIPESVLLSLGDVLTFGASKYGDNNWRSGIAYSRVYGALLRHLISWHAGEDLDPESGLSHLSHAACNIAFLIEYTKTGNVKLDDRPK